MLDAILDRAFLRDEPLPRNRAAFEALLERGKTRLPAARAEIGKIAAEILDAYYEVRQMLSQERSPVGAEALADLREQLAQLVYPGFLRQTPAEWLPHLPRYLRAMAVRLNKLRQAPDKDRQRSGDIIRLWNQYQQQAARNAEREQQDPELIRFRWLLEELRVSQFAQELKTLRRCRSSGWRSSGGESGGYRAGHSLVYSRRLHAEAYRGNNFIQVGSWRILVEPTP